MTCKFFGDQANGPDKCWTCCGPIDDETRHLHNSMAFCFSCMIDQSEGSKALYEARALLTRVANSEPGCGAFEGDRALVRKAIQLLTFLSSAEKTGGSLEH